MASSENKSKLKERLKAYGTFCPINDNCWAIVTNQTAAQVRDYLMEVIPARGKNWGQVNYVQAHGLIFR